MFIFNTMICPFLAALMLESTTGNAFNEDYQFSKIKEENKKTLAIIGLITAFDLQNFYTRLMIQLITMTIFDQMTMNFEKLTAIHKSIAKN